MPSKLERATSRLIILYERGQNTKTECMKCLSEIYDIDDETYLRTVYQSILNILEQQGTEWLEMPDEIANLPLVDIPAFVETLEALLETGSLLDNPIVSKYLFPDVINLEAKLSTDLLLAKKRVWNIPTYEQPKKPEAVVDMSTSLSFEWAKDNKDLSALATFIYLFCPPDDSKQPTPFKGKQQTWLSALEKAVNNTPSQSKQDKQVEAKEMREAGYDIQTIADTLGINRKTVTRWLK